MQKQLKPTGVNGNPVIQFSLCFSRNDATRKYYFKNLLLKIALLQGFY